MSWTLLTFLSHRNRRLLCLYGYRLGETPVYYAVVAYVNERFVHRTRVNGFMKVMFRIKKNELLVRALPI